MQLILIFLSFYISKFTSSEFLQKETQGRDMSLAADTASVKDWQ